MLTRTKPNLYLIFGDMIAVGKLGERLKSMPASICSNCGQEDSGLDASGLCPACVGKLFFSFRELNHPGAQSDQGKALKPGRRRESGVGCALKAMVLILVTMFAAGILAVWLLLTTDREISGGGTLVSWMVSGVLILGIAISLLIGIAAVVTLAFRGSGEDGGA